MLPFSAYVINLDRDQSRMAHMEEQAAIAGLNLTRFSAIDGRALPAHLSSFFAAPRADHSRGALKAGEAGCYASHLAVMQLGLSNQEYEATLVLEDDLILQPGFRLLLEKTLQALPQGWDIVRLSNPPKRAFVPTAKIDERHDLIRYSRIPNNAGAYLISRSGFAKMLNIPAPRFRAIDEDMRRPWDNGLNTFGIFPAPVTANVFDQSSIDALGSRGLEKKKRLFALREDPRRGLARLLFNIKALGKRQWLVCTLRNLQNHLVKGGKTNAQPERLRRRFQVGNVEPPRVCRRLQLPNRMEPS